MIIYYFIMLLTKGKKSPQRQQKSLRHPAAYKKRHMTFTITVRVQKYNLTLRHIPYYPSTHIIVNFM